MESLDTESHLRTRSQLLESCTDENVHHAIKEPDLYQNSTTGEPKMQLQPEATCLNGKTQNGHEPESHSSRAEHILDMPDELLVAIFEACFRLDSGTMAPAIIRNARLTCQRFLRTSSQFLCSVVCFDARETSLARLDKIMAHPTFGKAVKTLRFRDSTEYEADATCAAFVAGLKRAGSRITSLEVDVSNLQALQPSELRLIVDEAHLLRSAMCSLKRLSFKYDPYGQWPHTSCSRGIAGLRDFLTPLVNVETLESLEVTMCLWDLDPMFIPATADIVKVQVVWSNLSTVKLHGVAMQSAELAQLLKCTNSAKGCVRLAVVHLVNGSWIPILDILRRRHSLAALLSPSGAECELMLPDTYARMFGSYYEPGPTIELTEVCRYIRGSKAVNPLLPPLPEPETDS